MALIAKHLARHNATDAGTTPQPTEGYKRRVVLLALLGYVYVFSVLALTLGLIGLLVFLIIHYHRGVAFMIKLALPLGGLALIIVRALWVRFEPPTGLPLTRQNAQPLHAAIDELSTKLQAPAVHHVFLTDEFNAAVAQVPRLGLFGFYRNYLLIGLPLLQALSPEQFRAVLAHELAHLSHADGRAGAWIYRMRHSWSRLLARLQADEHWGQFLFLPFFRWYAPFFSAYSFALARAQEYAADRASTVASGPRSTADALLTLELQGEYLDRHYWPALFRSANHQAQPPLPFRQLTGALRAGAASAAADERLAAALRRQTDAGDTHPALRDRLTALGQEPRVPSPPEVTAAEWLFGAGYDQIVASLDRDWQRDVGPAWFARHDEAGQALAELHTLDQRHERGELSPEEVFQRARLTEEFGDEGQALPRYREALARDPASPDAQFATGRLLLAAGDEAGIALLDRAMDADWEYTLPACYRIIAFLGERDRDSEAEPYRRRALAHHERLAAAGAEREEITRRDIYISHGLGTLEIATIAGHLATFPQVANAYLVRKAVAHFEEKPVYILGIEIKQPWYLRRSAQTDHKLAVTIARAIDHPEVFYVVPLNRGNAWMRQPLQAVPDAPIYQRQ